MGRTLERRWDEALQALRKVEEDFARFLGAQPRRLGEADRERIRRLAAEVPTLWHAPTTTHADRRQIVRLLIDRVVLTVDSGGDHVGARIEWAGGAVRERSLPREVNRYRDQRKWQTLSARLAALHELGRDAEGDRDDPRPGRLPAAEASAPVHGRDGATVAPRAGAEAARAASDGGGRPVVGRGVVARSGADPGLIAAHVARLAKEGLDALAPVGWAWRPLGGVGRRD